VSLWFRFVMSDCQRDLRLWVEFGYFGLCNMSLHLWCAGVELGGGGRRRDKGQVGTCPADLPGVVKNGRDA
jgi:hypothetical protein